MEDLQETFDALKYNIVVDRSGTRLYFAQGGQLHRDEGPAIEYVSGSKEWYQNGVRHRENGPAVIWKDGCLEWWINGLRHRDTGPAIEWANGDKE